MFKRDRKNALADQSGGLEDLGPPSHELRCLGPVGLATPFRCKYENQMTATPEGFTLRPMLLFESIGRDDAPAARFRQLTDPVGVFRVSREKSVKVDYLVNILGFGKHFYAASQQRRHIRVEEKL